MSSQVDSAAAGKESGSMEAVKDITFGSIAGMTSKLFEHPFDLVKVRLQSQSTEGKLKFAGPLDCFQQTWAREGWKGLYRGVSAPLVGAACENASLFLVYNKAQDLIRSFDDPSSPSTSSFGSSSPSVDFTPGEEALSARQQGKKRELSLGELAVAAGGAGAVASFVLTPIELVKCRMQVQMMARDGLLEAGAPKPVSSAVSAAAGARSYSTSTTSASSTLSSHPLKPPIPQTGNTSMTSRPEGPIALIRSTVRQHGIRGLWLGQMGTLLRETGGSSAWFSAYETVSRGIISYHQSHLPASARKLTKADLKTWELMSAGACAGMSYNIVLFPADSIKSAMQTESELRPRWAETISSTTGERIRTQVKPQFWRTAKEIWTRRGLKGLYAGCGITVARAAPSSAMIFLIYESLESRFGQHFA